MTRIILSTALALTLAAGPALALSCLPSDLARTYHQAAEAEEVYVVVTGRLIFDEGKLPVVDYNNQQNTPQNTFIPARLTGQSLTLNGFDTGFDQEITLNAKCFGPWCASPVSDVSYMAFLERRATGYMLDLDPCGGMAFPEPSAALQEEVLQCFQGGPCEPDEQ